VSTPDAPDESDRSILFTYVVPFVGVLLLSVGIAAGVPGVYGIIQEDITTCGAPTVSVETPEETEGRFGDGPDANLARLEFAELSSAEQAAFRDAIDDPVREARVDGAFPHHAEFVNGTLLTYEGERYYVTVVAENPCFEAHPLQFPLGAFATALGVVGILTPPAYRRLVALEEALE
jgi:hypothetical protein